MAAQWALEQIWPLFRMQSKQCLPSPMAPGFHLRWRRPQIPSEEVLRWTERLSRSCSLLVLALLVLLVLRLLEQPPQISRSTPLFLLACLPSGLAQLASRQFLI